jgi:hypothetical protein
MLCLIVVYGDLHWDGGYRRSKRSYLWPYLVDVPKAVGIRRTGCMLGELNGSKTMEIIGT